jgi:periplasmic protein TonB
VEHQQPVNPIPQAPIPQVPTPHEPTITTTTDPSPVPTAPASEIGRYVPPEPPEPPAPPAADLSEGAAPVGNQGDWFPQDAYPGPALARGAEGRVSVSVAIGTDGRVTDCQVTSSSGDRDLDAATCRLAKRNGRFRPARDRDGHPIAGSASLRNVRWIVNAG